MQTIRMWMWADELDPEEAESSSESPPEAIEGEETKVSEANEGLWEGGLLRPELLSEVLGGADWKEETRKDVDPTTGKTSRL